MKSLKLKYIFPGLLALLLVFFGPETAMAATNDTFNQDQQEIINKLLGLFSILLNFLSAIFWPILYLIGALMNNDIFFSGPLGDRLNWIWVQMRNIVNIAFVLILIGIALYNILGIGTEGEYTIKKVLPRFILGLILVNFTFIGAKVVLDGANVVTQAAFALPTNFQTLAEKEALEKETWEEICKQQISSGNNVPQNTGTKSMIPRCEGLTDITEFDQWYEENKDTTLADSLYKQFGSHNAATLLAIHMTNISSNLNVSRTLDLTTGKVELTIENIGDLLFNVLFAALMFIVMGAAIVALFIVLVVRVVVLWVIIAVSPLAALIYVIPKIGEFLGEGNNAIGTFVQHAIAPAIIGVSISVGFLMLDALQGVSTLNFIVLTTGLKEVDPSAIVSEIPDLGRLLIAMISIAVIWIGVFTAADKTFAKGVTNAIKGGLETAGTFIAKAPLMARVIPGGAGAPPISPLSLARGVQNIPWQFENEYANPYNFATGQAGGGPDANALRRAFEDRSNVSLRNAFESGVNSGAAGAQNFLRNLARSLPNEYQDARGALETATVREGHEEEDIRAALRTASNNDADFGNRLRQARIFDPAGGGRLLLRIDQTQAMNRILSGANGVPAGYNFGTFIAAHNAGLNALRDPATTAVAGPLQAQLEAARDQLITDGMTRPNAIAALRALIPNSNAALQASYDAVIV